MKCVKLENGIQIIAETPFEQECLVQIEGKSLIAKKDLEKSWSGSAIKQLDLIFKMHPWDEK
jgi:hypothetical protein